MATTNKATCTNCQQTLTSAPDVNNSKLKVENCIRCGRSNYVADDREAE